jgi:hypothetical protein
MAKSAAKADAFRTSIRVLCVKRAVARRKPRTATRWMIRSERAAQRIVATVCGVRDVPDIGVVASWVDDDVRSLRRLLV